MTDEERADLLRAMYGGEDDDDANRPATATPPAPVAPLGDGLRAKKVLVHGKFIDVPNLDYLMRLEKLLVEQGKTIRRLDREVSSLRQFIKRQTSTLREMSSDLNNKIDRRD